MKRLIAGYVFISAGLSAPASAFHPIDECQAGYVAWEGRPLRDLVEHSSDIYLATAKTFTPDSSKEGFDGYYTFESTGTELKGGGQGIRKIYGRSPYEYPPQSYFSIDRNHQVLNIDSIYGGETFYIQDGDYCHLMPRFVIGYRYLIFIGIESRMSFEPIHSTTQDAWMSAVIKATVKSRP